MINVKENIVKIYMDNIKKDLTNTIYTIRI